MSAPLPDLDPGRVALGDLSILPGPASNVANCNSLPFTQDPLVTAEGRQYAVWISGSRRTPHLAVRELPSGEWCDPLDLGDSPGGPFGESAALDPHHSYSLGIDGESRLHMAGNQHNQPLRYGWSEGAHPSRWRIGEMVGAEEESVTYPAFATLPDGTLLFAYRAGRAGRGDIYLNRLRERRWQRVGHLVAGGTDESPYLNHIAVGRDGSVHISGCFRGRGGAAANRDVWHAASPDGGEGWLNAAGKRLKLPLSHESAPLVVSTRPHGSGLVNQMGMDVDAAGRPHVAYFQYDARGATQVLVASHGDGWRSRQLGRSTHRMETDTPILDASIARPTIACTSDGNVWAVLRSAHDGRGGRVTCVRCTPGLPLREFVLYDGDLGAWEPTLDSRALRERDELHLLLTPAPPYPIGEPGSLPEQWRRRAIGVLSIDADDLAAAADEEERQVTSSSF